MLAVTRRLPRWKGLGRVPIWLSKLYLRKPRTSVEARVWDMKMRLAPDQFVDGWLLFAPQFYEAAEMRAALSYLSEGDVFVDIGAHIGLYTLQAARRVGVRGVVVAIEPNQTSALELRHNVKLNHLSNVRIIEEAASGATGERTLVEPSASNRAGATMIGDVIGRGAVPARPLSEILRGEGVVRPDVAKVDIEGAEYEVLSRYFTDAPPELWPRVVLTEHHAHLAMRRGNALELLRSRGYRLVARFESNYLFEFSSSV